MLENEVSSGHRSDETGKQDISSEQYKEEFINFFESSKKTLTSSDVEDIVEGVLTAENLFTSSRPLSKAEDPFYQILTKELGVSEEQKEQLEQELRKEDEITESHRQLYLDYVNSWLKNLKELDESHSVRKKIFQKLDEKDFLDEYELNSFEDILKLRKDFSSGNVFYPQALISNKDYIRFKNTIYSEDTSGPSDSDYKFYLCPDPKHLTTIARKIVNLSEQHDYHFNFKMKNFSDGVPDSNERKMERYDIDRLVIYSAEEEIGSVIKILRKIYSENPVQFENRPTPGLTKELDFLPGVGAAETTPDSTKGSSYHKVRANLISRLFDEILKEIVNENPGFQEYLKEKDESNSENSGLDNTDNMVSALRFIKRNDDFSYGDLAERLNEKAEKIVKTYKFSVDPNDLTRHTN
ncbi:MAG: T3SS effector HopA1 family protein [Candidatus Magasanikbacteria bacterium]